MKSHTIFKINSCLPLQKSGLILAIICLLNKQRNSYFANWGMYEEAVINKELLRKVSHCLQVPSCAQRLSTTPPCKHILFINYTISAMGAQFVGAHGPLEASSHQLQPVQSLLTSFPFSTFPLTVSSQPAALHRLSVNQRGL